MKRREQKLGFKTLIASSCSDDKLLPQDMLLTRLDSAEDVFVVNMSGGAAAAFNASLYSDLLPVWFYHLMSIYLATLSVGGVTLNLGVIVLFLKSKSVSVEAP